VSTAVREKRSDKKGKKARKQPETPVDEEARAEEAPSASPSDDPPAADEPLAPKDENGAPTEEAEAGSLEEAALRGSGKVTARHSNEHAFGELDSTLEADDLNEARRVGEASKESISPGFPIPRKVVAAAAVLAVLLVLPYLVKKPADEALETKGRKTTTAEKVRRLRVFTEGVSVVPDDDEDERMANAVPPPINSVGEMSLPGETLDSQNRADELESGPADAKGPIAHEERKNVIPASLDEGKPPISLDDPSGHALDHFFDKLMAAERKDDGAIVRIVYYGDSIVASDFITGKLRRMLQTRFGDAGHGYAIAANAYAGWFHLDVARKASDQWKASRCIGPFAEDSLYGLGCASFIARKPDEYFMMGTADKDDWGRKVSHFDVEYLKQPGGGDLDLILDGSKLKSISTEGDDKVVAWEKVDVDDGPHKLEVRTTTDKPTRVFGMRMERDNPGVTLTALGMTGACMRYLDKQEDKHWDAVLKRAQPDLVVLAFGTNESAAGAIAFDDNGVQLDKPMDVYQERAKKVMDRIRAAVPDVSYMLVGPPDMASKNEAEGHAKPTVPLFVDAQKSVAGREGWAFWNQFKAMGGSGSMWAWVQSGLGQADMIHPTGTGGNVLGKMEYLALMEKYEAYKASKR
jgi:lysophospholipase L1-like esterase